MQGLRFYSAEAVKIWGVNVRMLSTKKRIWLKTWPKIVVMVIGILSYLGAVRLNEDLKGLLINIAATLISIPIIFILYDIWNERSHRVINERVYRYAENEMSLAMLKIRKQMELLLYGLAVYFEPGDFIIDDTDFINQTVRLNDEAKIVYDEDGDPYQRKYQIEDYEDEYREDIYSYEKDTVVSAMADVNYLGFQVLYIDMEDIVGLIDELINNSFIMERMDDTETEVIVHLAEALRLLNAFTAINHNNLFLKSNIKVNGFEIYKAASQFERLNYYTLFYREREDQKIVYEQELDKRVLPDIADEDLLAVYVVNPDRYIILGDLLTEVISCIDDWRKTGAGSIYTDHESGYIGFL